MFCPTSVNASAFRVGTQKQNASQLRLIAVLKKNPEKCFRPLKFFADFGTIF